MADTVVNTLYPPEVDTFQPAFDCKKSANITFSLSSFNNINDISFIHISIVDNRNNENVLSNFLKPSPVQIGIKEGTNEPVGQLYGISNGILYIEMPKFDNKTGRVTKGFVTYDANKDKYAVSIPPYILKYNDDKNKSY